MRIQRREWLTRMLAALGLAGLARVGVRAQEAKKPGFAEEFGPDWETAKAYTLEVASAMPAEKYDFKPTPEMRPFGELMGHIAIALYGITAAVRGEQPPAQPPQDSTKDSVIPFLTGAFDYVAQSVAALSEARLAETARLFGGRLEMPVWKVFHFVRDHTTHHRAYGLPYLRMCGVQPPNYRFAGRRPSPV